MDKDFFTNPNNNLTQESSIDPMGLQVIWQDYSQKIFGKKLTTVANDIRIFSINLFHHYLVYQIFKEETRLKNLASNYKVYKNNKALSRDLKLGMLICLENLATVTFYEANQEGLQEFDTSGIPGTFKATTRMNNDEDIQFSIDRRMGLLKNQVNLGMAGRYKGPMMKMNLFERDLSYHNHELDQLSALLENSKELLALKSILIKLFFEILFNSDYKESPTIYYSELKRKTSIWPAIKQGYLDCFGKRAITKPMRDYFLHNLGLKNGAAGLIYDAIELKKSYDGSPGSDLKSILTSSLNHCKDEKEADKISNIINIEPTLSHAEYFLRKLADPSTTSIAQIKDELLLLRVEINKQKSFLPLTDNARLKQLAHLMFNENTLEDWAMDLSNYHKKLMELRYGEPWFTINDEGEIRHLFSPVLSNNIKSVQEYLKSRHWFHHYYLYTLIVFKNILN
jgi:hypothetical protein